MSVAILVLHFLAILAWLTGRVRQGQISSAQSQPPTPVTLGVAPSVCRTVGLFWAKQTDRAVRSCPTLRGQNHSDSERLNTASRGRSSIRDGAYFPTFSFQTN